MKKSAISIGIVAHNEERNIQNVIFDVLTQQRKSWSLKHVYVACDGCTDETVKRIHAIKDTHIHLINSSKRQGKAVNEQKIFDVFRDDILVMLDADVRLTNDIVIENLIHPLTTQNNVYLTGGNPQPFSPATFIERAVYTTFKVLDESRKQLKNGNNIYGASGQCLALKQALVREIKFPPMIVAEDDYIYFTCISLGWKFRHIRSAIVNYKLPASLSDYFHQTQRSDTLPAIKNVEAYFTANMVRSAYARPVVFYIREVVKTLFHHPIEAIFIILFRLYSRMYAISRKKQISPQWKTAKSTK